jgi:hypothetical protein
MAGLAWLDGAVRDFVNTERLGAQAPKQKAEG